MNTKHTEGPWQIGNKNGNLINYIFSEDGEHIAEVSFLTVNPKRREANAKLIAAAPDLLSALKAIQEELELNQPCMIERIAIVSHNAINKAEAS